MGVHGGMMFKISWTQGDQKTDHEVDKLTSEGR